MDVCVHALAPPSLTNPYALYQHDLSCLDSNVHVEKEEVSLMKCLTSPENLQGWRAIQRTCMYTICSFMTAKRCISPKPFYFPPTHLPAQPSKYPVFHSNVFLLSALLCINKQSLTF